MSPQQLMLFKFTELDLLILVLGFVIGFISFLFFILKENPWKPLYWPTIPAVIEDSKIQKIPSAVESKFTFKPLVIFRYNYKGTDYIGDRYTQIIRGEKDIVEVQRKIELYLPGTNVLCHVNPKDPRIAYLDVSKLRAILFTLAMSVLMIGFPITAFLIVIFRDRN